MQWADTNWQKVQLCEWITVGTTLCTRMAVSLGHFYVIINAIYSVAMTSILSMCVLLFWSLVCLCGTISKFFVTRGLLCGGCLGCRMAFMILGLSLLFHWQLSNHQNKVIRLSLSALNLWQVWVHGTVIVHTPAHPVMSTFASVFACCCIAVLCVAVYMFDIAVMFVALHVCAVAWLLLHDCCFMVMLFQTWCCVHIITCLLVIIWGPTGAQTNKVH